MSLHRRFLSRPAARWMLAAAFSGAFLALVAGAARAESPAIEAPTPVQGLIYARRFTLEEGFPYQWSAERPWVREGMLLVIEADPDLLHPRESGEPVLYAGRFPLRRLARDENSGRLLVLVPARLNLSEERIWFGAPDLPERVTTAQALEQERVARSSGLAPLDRSVVRAALRAGGAVAELRTREELWRLIEDLVAEYVADGDPSPTNQRR